MPGSNINDLRNYCNQWKEYSLKIIFSDIDTYKIISDYNISQFPLINALPEELIAFIDKSNSFISDYKKTKSKDTYASMLAYMTDFCNTHIPTINLCNSKLDNIREQLTSGISDINTELVRLNSELDSLYTQYDDCDKSTPNPAPFPYNRQLMILSCFGEDNYMKMTNYGYLVNRYNFIKSTLANSVNSIQSTNQILIPLNAKLSDMQGDINNNDTVLAEVITFITQLDS